MGSHAVGRLWKGVKFERAYVRGKRRAGEVNTSLRHHFEFHNRCRRHSSLDLMSPEQFYFNLLLQLMTACAPRQESA